MKRLALFIMAGILVAIFTKQPTLPTSPTPETCVSLDHAHGKLRVFEHCNLHRTWEGDVDIEVTD